MELGHLLDVDHHAQMLAHERYMTQLRLSKLSRDGAEVLTDLSRSAVDWSCWAWVSGDRECWQGLVLAAESCAAAFVTVAEDPLTPVHAELAGRAFELAGTDVKSVHNVGRWIIGFNLCAITRHRAGLDNLCQVEPNVYHEAPYVHYDTFLHDHARALRSAWLREPAAGKRLVDSLSGTRPEMLQFADCGWVLEIEVPTLTLLTQLLARDAEAFNAALSSALELHRSYWTQGDRRRDWNGFLALGPLAMACLAFDLGLNVEVDSPYAPRWIVERDLPASPKVFDPYVSQEEVLRNR